MCEFPFCLSRARRHAPWCHETHSCQWLHIIPLNDRWPKCTKTTKQLWKKNWLCTCCMREETVNINFVYKKTPQSLFKIAHSKHTLKNLHVWKLFLTNDIAAYIFWWTFSPILLADKSKEIFQVSCQTYDQIGCPSLILHTCRLNRWPAVYSISLPFLFAVVVVVPECEKSSATTYFWYRQTLNITSSIDDTGGLNWKMTLSLLVAWILVCLAVIKGIQSSGKVQGVGGFTAGTEPANYRYCHTTDHCTPPPLYKDTHSKSF